MRSSGQGRLLDGRGLDGELAAAEGAQGPAAGLELTLEDEAGEGIHHGLLDEPLQRPGAVVGVEAAGPAPRGQAQRGPSGRTRRRRVRSRGSRPGP